MTSLMQRSFIRLLLLSIFFASLQVSAQERGQLAAMKATAEGGYNFWLYAPPEYVVDGERVPVLVFLHGRSLCGTDMQKVRRYGPLDALQRGLYFPCFIIAPQNPGGPWKPEKIMQCLEWVEQNYDVDSNRFYAIGMSLGGYGVMDFAGTYPDRIAAAMPICGGTTLKDKSGLGQLPLWILHGTADRAINIEESKKVVRSLQETHQDELLRYSWWEGASHGDLARLMYSHQAYDWLFWHNLADDPRETYREIDITLSDLKDVYQQLVPEWTQFDVVKKISKPEN